VRTIILERAAARELDKLPADVRTLVDQSLSQLAISGPYGMDIKRLKGRDELRLRIGDWRVIFSLAEHKVVVGLIAHRRHVYVRM
jgi:mRNA interferase RelE/StbE